MNLWVKRTGQLVSLAVALFFLSCQDDVSVLGYRNPNSKFDIKYIEIPLESNVFLTDSVRTTIFSGDVPRLLVGAHDDPAIGIIKTIGYTQIEPARFTKDPDTVHYIYDSAAVQLRFDYYAYGGQVSTTVESFSIHEIGRKLDPDSAYKYYSTTEIPYNTDHIGSNSFGVNAGEFKTQFNSSAPDTAVLNITIKDPDFGENLWELIQFNGTEPESEFNERFADEVFGFAIVPANNQKIVGFNPNSSFSRLVLYYHQRGFKEVKTFSFLFAGIQYTNIKADFDDDLDGLVSNYDSVRPLTKRYLQQGTRVITKVDLKNFYSFADTVDRMIINSCELSITGVDDEATYYHIPSIGFVPMSEVVPHKYNKTKYIYPPIINNAGDTTGYTRDLSTGSKEYITDYQGFMNDLNGVFSAMDDTKGQPVMLQWNGTGYSEYMTLMAQHLSLREPTSRPRYFALFPSVPSNPQKEKSVNRIVFNKENLRLKIYYTTPKELAQ